MVCPKKAQVKLWLKLILNLPTLSHQAPVLTTTPSPRPICSYETKGPVLDKSLSLQISFQKRLQENFGVHVPSDFLFASVWVISQVLDHIKVRNGDLMLAGLMEMSSGGLPVCVCVCAGARESVWEKWWKKEMKLNEKSTQTKKERMRQT